MKKTSPLSQKPLIADIKRNRLEDGPGIRTTVFFKGCPLHCLWCHNPETQTPEAELMYLPTSCIRCNSCQIHCPQQAIVHTPEANRRIRRDLCQRCFTCLLHCPSSALRKIGSFYSIHSLLKELLRDEPYYRHSGGGVTLSGGEPLRYPHYISKLVKKLHTEDIAVIIQTSGVYNSEYVTLHIMPYIHSLYFDIKCIDSELHRRYTGVSNSVILSNFMTLVRHQQWKEKVLTRVPLVPGLTDTDKNLQAIRQFLTSLHISTVQLIAYNPTWHHKSLGIGMIPAFSSEFQEKQVIEHAKAIFQDFEVLI